MTYIPEEIIKVFAAILIGGLIGLEREYRDKAAGFRTIIFITVGSTLFTIFSTSFSQEGDPARIAANIVTGIGFLGAGAIIREKGKIAGLTTAATIWLTAALGMGIGAGKYLFVGAATLAILFILWIFPGLEHWLDNIHETHTYEIVLPVKSKRRATLADDFRQCRLRVSQHHDTKSGEQIMTTWMTSGHPRNHQRLIALLIDDPEIVEFR